MNIQRAFPAFSVVFVLTYALWFVAADRGLFSHNALFAYYPALGDFSWTPLAKPVRETGPVMLWYGWVANSVIAGTIGAAIVLATPLVNRTKLWVTLTWAAPIIAFIVLCYFERLWFIK